MKKRVFGIMLSLALMLTMIPVLGMTQTAFAGDATSTAALTIDANTTEDIGNLEKDHYHYDASENILTLNNYVYSGDADIGIELVNVTTDFTIKLEGSNSITSTATGGSGIQCDSFEKNLTIKGTGSLTASGFYGIFTPFCHTVISSGTVIATGSGNGSYGINAWSCDVTISGGKITAIGDGAGISGNVINTITGTGWTDTAGTTGIADINTSEAGQELSAYKKVVFPAAEKYPLWVGNTQVTSANAKDVKGDGGSVVYTPKDGDKPAILTLTDAKITEVGGSGYTYNIEAFEDLTLVLNGNNTIDSGTESKDPAGYALNIEGGDLTIEGSGTLTVNGLIQAIGIGSEFKINDGHITATSQNHYAIYTVGGIVMNKGQLTAESEKDAAIYANGVTINGGIVTATGGSHGISFPSSADASVNIRRGSTLTATGGFAAINGNVVNDIIGTGWTKTGDMVKIPVSSGQDLYKYKKVRFPQEPATVDPKPTAKNLVANGSAQELVTAGKASGGTLQYALGNDAATAPATGWGTSIPTGTNAGTYYVWYKAVGDDMHSDSEPECVTSTISEKQAPSKKTARTVVVAKAIASGKTKAKVSWNNAGADRYVIYFAKCGRSLKKYKTVNGKTRSVTVSKLRKRSQYKFRVLAQKKSGKSYRTIATSAYAHMAAGNVCGRYTNVKDLKVNRSAVDLGKGMTFNIKTSLTKVKKNKRLFNLSHDPNARFITSDPGVAVVDSKGKITARGTGTCCIYVQAVNGIWKTVKVTVK